MTNEFKGLRHYIDIVEGKDQAVDEAGIMNALGQLGGAVGGTVANGVNAVGNAVGGAYDAAKQGVTGAVDAAGKAISGAVDPLVQGAKQGYAAATGAPAPTQQAAAKPQAGQSASPKAGGKSDPAVLKLQQDLIAKGAKIKADGIMGPATQAAQKQFGDAAKNPAGTTNAATAIPTGGLENPANQAAAPAAGQSASPAEAPAASNATANTTGGPTNLGTAGTQATAGGYAPAPAAAAPAAPENPFAPKADPKVAAWAKLSPAQQKWMGGADPTDPIILARMRKAVPDAPAAAPQQATMEGAGYDEIQRLVSLVQYR